MGDSEESDVEVVGVEVVGRVIMILALSFGPLLAKTRPKEKWGTAVTVKQGLHCGPKAPLKLGVYKFTSPSYLADAPCSIFQVLSYDSASCSSQVRAHFQALSTKTLARQVIGDACFGSRASIFQCWDQCLIVGS